MANGFFNGGTIVERKINKFPVILRNFELERTSLEYANRLMEHIAIQTAESYEKLKTSAVKCDYISGKNLASKIDQILFDLLSKRNEHWDFFKRAYRINPNLTEILYDLGYPA